MVGWTTVEADALIVTVGLERGQKVTMVLVVRQGKIKCRGEGGEASPACMRIRGAWGKTTSSSTIIFKKANIQMQPKQTTTKEQ